MTEALRSDDGFAVAKAYRADPYSYAEARALADELGLSEPVAITLVRRGYRTVEEARAFLGAGESHDPSCFAGIDAVCEQILEAIAEDRAITVHGDFDVDGVCSTTIAVSALRSLGARCDWLIPDRQADGYGLSSDGVHRLHERGTSLILTVDCAITAVEEVELAKSLGMQAIVTDHHQPKDTLPDCPIVHPAVSGYPFEELCGTAVAWKLMQRLHQLAPQSLTGGPETWNDTDQLDLVALATVADLVPLIGENRNLVRRGLAVARRSERPGFAALAAASGVDTARMDEGDMGFRLGPRINAAGRLYRADAGVELMLTADRDRADEIAEELNRANTERRFTEREVSNSAESALRELPERLRGANGLVLAGEGWHPGVVGIVASRIVEAHGRPAILLSIGPDGSARGSGRSIPGFDLLAGLEACSQHLTRFGGHRMAAGLELPATAIPAFREAFAAHAAALIGPDELRRTQRIDAVVGGQGIGMGLAEELGKLAPFGNGNPGVRLLVPSARVRDVRGMGEEGRHSRFSLHSGSHRALGVAFGRPSLAVTESEQVDVAVRLEVNEWNGSVEPRLVLSELYPLGDEAPFGVEDDAEEGAPALSVHECSAGAEEWWRRFEAELALEPGAQPAPSTLGAEAGPAGARRTEVSHGSSAAAIVAELVSSGEEVLAVSADAGRRAAIAAGAAGLARFGGGRALIVCHRCLAPGLEELSAGEQRLVLTDYAALVRDPGLAQRFGHVVLIDPPSSQAEMAAAGAAAAGVPGFLHPAWTAAEAAFASSVAEEQLGLRMALRAMFRDLRDCGPAGGEQVRASLAGSGRYARSPELAARCARVLGELGLIQWEPDRVPRSLGAVSSVSVKLESSAAFRAYAERHQEAQRFLERHKQP